LAVNRQKFIHGPQVEKPWSKQIKPSGAAYRRLKRQQGNNLTKYARSIYAYKKAENIGRARMRKVPQSRKNEKQDPFQFVSV